MIQFGGVFRGRRVLITGHTGFKGSWLAVWLNELGATLCGVSLEPDTRPSHWELVSLDMEDHRVDVRDMDRIGSIIESFRPEIVFHLAAQPLVRRSYREPIETWSTNVMGTAHVLEACRQVGTARAVVVVTTDKVYVNDGRATGYQETDRLGGHDPYSASKAACELLVDSYRKAYFSNGDTPLLASARAGNVIGGGDWSEDRLVPDLVKAVSQQRPVVIRAPDATRPWQHVLECLAGYLMLGQGLLEGRRELASGWNFGPVADDNRTVESVLVALQGHWPALTWETGTSPQPHESLLLYLDHSGVKEALGWSPVWSLERTLQATAEWYKAFHEKTEVLTRDQLKQYVEDAQLANVSWVSS